MRAGDLTERITIRRLGSNARNDFNEPVPTWSELITVRAKVHHLTNVEQLRAQEIGAEITTRFITWFCSEVASVGPADRLIYGGREYNITGVREVELRVTLEIGAVARAEP